MKLSTRSRYGVRIMLDLALHAGEGPVRLGDVAERQGIADKVPRTDYNPSKKGELRYERSRP